MNFHKFLFSYYFQPNNTTITPRKSHTSKHPYSSRTFPKPNARTHVFPIKPLGESPLPTNTHTYTHAIIYQRSEANSLSQPRVYALVFLLLHITRARARAKKGGELQARRLIRERPCTPWPAPRDDHAERSYGFLAAAACAREEMRPPRAAQGRSRRKMRERIFLGFQISLFIFIAVGACVCETNLEIKEV